jgi:hypothetical protein
MTTEEHREFNVGVYQGLGRPEVVLLAWAEAMGDVPEVGHDLRTLQEVAVRLLGMPDTAKFVVAFACSVLNREYRECGIAFSVDETGKWGWSEESNTQVRTAIWDGLVNLTY